MESKLIPMLAAMHRRNFPGQRAGDVIMTHLAAVIVDEIDEIEQRDRKICISLDRKVNGADRELAQWLIDHPRYSGKTVAGWLGCEERRVQRLRIWAKRGFSTRGPQSRNPYRKSRNPATSPDAPLKSFENDDFEPSDDVESSAVILKNVLDTIDQSKGVAEAYRKIFKASPFDCEAKQQIDNAIMLLIRKWRSVQSLLLQTRGNKWEIA
jgi:hypothetical protein